MRNQRRQPSLIGLSVLAAGTLLFAGFQPLAAQASQPQKSGFTFKLDPVAIEYLNQSVDTNSAKLEEYRDFTTGIRGFVHLTGESADGETELAFNATEAGRRDGRYTLTFGTPGAYRVLLDLNKIPHYYGNDGHMLWTKASDNRLVIPDAERQAIQNAITAAPRSAITFSFLNNLLAPYLGAANPLNLRIERNRELARLDLGMMGPFNVGLEYTHEKRQGERAYGGSFGFSNATEIPEPIDYDTTGAELSGEWSGKLGGLRLGYRYSKFDNANNSLIWDNPFRATDSTDPAAYTAPGSGSINGAAHGIAALAPDNKADVFFVDGRARLGGGWTLSGNVVRDTMKQDQTLLPYTLNTAIRDIADNGTLFDPTNPANLPVSTANQKVSTTEASAQAGTRFGGSWDLLFRYRYYNYDDQSPRIEFPGYVRFHAVWEPLGRITVPDNYKVQTAGAELGWDLAARTHLALSFDRQTWDRELREVKTTDENIVKLSLDTRPVDRWSIRGSYEHGDRTISAYNTNASEFSFTEVGGVSTNLPDLRKYDEAARTYNSYKLLAQWMATEAWNLSFGVSGRKDDYDKSAFGLISDDVKNYNAELSYAPNDTFNFFVFGERSDRTSFQQDRQSAATPSTSVLDNWSARLTETTDTWGLGLTAKLSKALRFNLQGNWSKNDGKADLFSPPGGSPDLAVGFNNYDDIELKALLARLEYRFSEHLSAGVSYRYEDYTIDSFLLQGLVNYLPGSLLLNADNGSYRAKVYGVDMKLYF